MNIAKMGAFIAELRKAKNMTQKDLASKLNITDKAVSKWERGICCPDISILTSLGEALGVTESELLNGQREEEITKNTEVNKSAAKIIDRTSENKISASGRKISAMIFSLALLVGVAASVITDFAISGDFTWSLYPLISIIFTWIVVFPSVRFVKNGPVLSLTGLTLLILPYLYLMDLLVKSNNLIFKIGLPTALVGIVFLWGIFLIFKLLKNRKMTAAGISALLAIPVSGVINYILSKIISEPIIDVWDIMSAIIILAVAIVFLIIGGIRQKYRSI